MMEMDSPFLPNYGAAIDGKNFNVLKRGQTITLTCKVLTEHENSNKHSSQIDWMKDGELVSLKVIHSPYFNYQILPTLLFQILIYNNTGAIFSLFNKSISMYIQFIQTIN